MSGPSRHPVYFVKGDDPSLVAQAATSLISSLIEGQSRDLVVEDISEESDMSAVVDACQTPAFLTDRRVVVVSSAGRFRADEVDPLIEYLTAPMPTTSLVLLAGGGAMPTRLQKAITKTGHVIDVSAPAGKARRGWVTERLREAPIDLDRAATDLVVERLGDELGQLEGVIDAVAAAYGEGSRLGAAQLEPFLGSGGDAAPWELTDAIDGGDTRTALLQLRRMLDGGQRHPLVILATLQKHVTNLARLDGAGIASEAEAAAALSISPYPAKKALTQSRKLGSAAIARAVMLVSQADIDLRGASSWPAEMTLEVLVARLSKLKSSVRNAATTHRG